MYDVIIIGAGVTGAAVARELSRYKLNVCVLDKEEDVCCGTSKANSAIVHAGFDAAPGSLMARFNVRGNEMMGDLAKDLATTGQTTSLRSARVSFSETAAMWLSLRPDSV